MAFGLDIRFSFYCVERYTCCDFLVLSLSFIFRNTKNIITSWPFGGVSLYISWHAELFKGLKAKTWYSKFHSGAKLPCEQACIFGRSCSFCNPKICLLNTSKSKLTNRLCSIQLAQYRKKKTFLKLKVKRDKMQIITKKIKITPETIHRI